jgi:hypothetical protein
MQFNKLTFPEKAAHVTFAFQSGLVIAPQGMMALLTRGAATGLN